MKNRRLHFFLRQHYIIDRHNWLYFAELNSYRFHFLFVFQERQEKLYFLYYQLFVYKCLDLYFLQMLKYYNNNGKSKATPTYRDTGFRT